MRELVVASGLTVDQLPLRLPAVDVKPDQLAALVGGEPVTVDRHRRVVHRHRATVTQPVQPGLYGWLRRRLPGDRTAPDRLASRQVERHRLLAHVAADIARSEQYAGDPVGVRLGRDGADLLLLSWPECPCGFAGAAIKSADHRRAGQDQLVAALPYRTQRPRLGILIAEPAGRRHALVGRPSRGELGRFGHRGVRRGRFVVAAGRAGGGQQGGEEDGEERREGIAASHRWFPIREGQQCHPHLPILCTSKRDRGVWVSRRRAADRRPRPSGLATQTPSQTFTYANTMGWTSGGCCRAESAYHRPPI